MKRLLVILLMLVNTTILAQTPNKPWSVTTGFTTDYVARGTTQSLNKPAGFITGEYNLKGFYIGGYVSTMDFGDGTTVETDGWLGYRFAFKGFNFDTAFSYYGYPNGPVTWDMQEVKLITSKNLNKKTLLAYTIAYSPDYFNVSGPSLWNELALTYNITDKFSISGGVAQQTIFEHPETYSTFNVGATYFLKPNIALDARYADTDRHDLGIFYENSVSFTIRFTY